MKTLIIIPTYNEKQNIEIIIKKVKQTLFSADILIVDDNSNDGTIQIVKKIIDKNLHKIYIEIRNNKDGLGKAYIHGFKWAIKNKYKYIIQMDADLSHNPKDLKKIFKNLKRGYDVCIGSRYINGINVINWPIERIILSYIASKYVKIITKMPIKDPTSGFVGYNLKTLQKINLDKIKSRGYAFQIEMKYLCWRRKFKIKEIPIIFYDRLFGKSKLDKSIINEAIIRTIILRLNTIIRGS